mmetsp:Transcript_21616/g.46883  ORF Transcript_21616/g.46883 Transcript_21616/m.46883 type:complete len:120 (-) Transcript_21616:805-1164(-)
MHGFLSSSKLLLLAKCLSQTFSNDDELRARLCSCFEFRHHLGQDTLFDVTIVCSKLRLDVSLNLLSSIVRIVESAPMIKLLPNQMLQHIPSSSPFTPSCETSWTSFLSSSSQWFALHHH